MSDLTFASVLADWQRRCGRRDLPWQRFDTAYERWVSEVMLQQTQVETVIPYYERFLKSFPTVEALAAAPEELLMRHWAGLGYYSRARNLQRAARRVAGELGGVFPTTAAGLAELPGVGPSTAAAVAAFTSHEAVEPMVDGNVKRVLARVHRVPGRIGERAFEAELDRVARAALPGPGDIAAYTQGLMDLGSLICRRRAPACAGCPVRSFCRAFAAGDPEAWPQPKRRIEKTERWLSAAFVLTEDGLWLGAPAGGIWRGLAVPPTVDAEAPWNEALTPALFGWTGNWRFEPLGEVKRELTHRRLRIRAALCRPAGDVAEDLRRLRAAGFSPRGREPAAWPGMPVPMRAFALAAAARSGQAD